MSRRDPHQLIGQWLPGGIRLRKLVGQGAFAWVFQATMANGETAAVKVLQSDSPEARTMFTREVKVLRALPESEYCVRFIDDGLTDEGLPFFAMEFVDGCTLKDAMKFKPVWEINEACNLMLQLCAALVGLHRLGVAHRDLKPENVMLTQDWQVKLTDFGLVKDAQGLLKLFETEDILTGRDFEENVDRAMLAGTPEYMAPEQFLDPMEEDETKAQTDTWSDVYSLGLIFYQLLSGEKLFPFNADNSSQGAYARSLLAYVRSRTNFDDRNLDRPGEIPPGLWPLIVKAVKQDPRRRFHTAGELYDGIEKYLDEGGKVEFVEEEHTRMADMSELLAQLENAHSAQASRAAAVAPPPAALSKSSRPAPRRTDSIRPSGRPKSVFPPRPSARSATAQAHAIEDDDLEPATMASGPLDVAAVQAYREQRLNAPGVPQQTLPPDTMRVRDVYNGGAIPAPMVPRVDSSSSGPFQSPWAQQDAQSFGHGSAHGATSSQPSHAIPPPWSPDADAMPLVPRVPPLPPATPDATRADRSGGGGMKAVAWILALILLGAGGFALWWTFLRAP